MNDIGKSKNKIAAAKIVKKKLCVEFFFRFVPVG